MDFTLRKYARLCRAISQSGYTPVSFSDYLRRGRTSLKDKLIIFRHDVDRLPKTALRMAKIEKKFGINASYYFRIPYSWNKKIILSIANLGHEVGLHYECLDKAKGNFEKSAEILKKDLDKLRKLVTVTSVAMHGNPMTPFDNRDIWKHYDLKDFGLLGEVYLNMDFQKFLYYSDSGRTWDGRYNIKDTIPITQKKINKPKFNNTEDIINFMSIDNRNLYILTHPNRWSGSLLEWIYSYFSDLVINTGKLTFSAWNKFIEKKK